MKLIPAKTPGFVKSLFPNFIWNIDTDKKELYLTFDDGPTPEITAWVLEQLKKYNAKATFFCIGSNVEKHPEIFQQIIADGHIIGNHTHNHLKGWKCKTKNYLENTIRCQKTIEKNRSQFNADDGFANSKNQKINSKAFHDTNCDLEFKNWNLDLFRPPYGKLKTKQAKKLQKLGYKIVMWDVLSFDWDASVSEEECLKNVINSAKEGSIIVFHDSVKAKPNLRYVLPRVLAYYSEKGFIFKKI